MPVSATAVSLNRKSSSTIVSTVKQGCGSVQRSWQEVNNRDGRVSRVARRARDTRPHVAPTRIPRPSWSPFIFATRHKRGSD